MRSKTLASLAVLSGLVALPAFAQVPNVPNSPRPKSIIAALESVPPHEVPAGNGSMAVKEFANWAGYAVTGSSFTSVLGSWVVPAYHCLKTPNSDSFVFVGMDGYPTTNKTIEAVGTVANCVGTQYQYAAWYELGPTVTVITGYTVKSGDLISAEVSYGGGEFFVSISDLTQGWLYSTSAVVSGAKRSSAEWIVGRSTYLPPLMDFGKVNSGFDYTSITDSDWATDSSISGPISDFGSKVKINMVNGGVTLATTSALTTDGSSFTVSWKHE